MKSRLPLLVVLFLLNASSACVPSRQKTVLASSPSNNWLPYWKEQKIAVICVRGDGPTRERLESRIAEKLRSKEINAVERKTLFPESAEFSWGELHSALRKSEITAVLQISYDGPIPEEKIPEGIHFNLFQINETKTQRRRREGLGTLLQVIYFPAMLLYGK
jgi:hypothetical protein